MAHNVGKPGHECADVASDRQVAVLTEGDAQTSATKPRSTCHADEEVLAAAAASLGVPYPEQDHSLHVAHTAADNQTMAADTDASQPMPASSPATGRTSDVPATAPNTIKPSQPASSGADVAAAAAGAHQPDATPFAAPQSDPQVGPSSQATAPESRPSFLSMLQNKMDKQRQQRRESQSAGSASESSLSSVHAAGANSVEKSGPSVDSGASWVMLIVFWPSIVAKHWFLQQSWALLSTCGRMQATIFVLCCLGRACEVTMLLCSSDVKASFNMAGSLAHTV